MTQYVVVITQGTFPPEYGLADPRSSGNSHWPWLATLGLSGEFKVLHGQVVVLQVDVQVREDQGFLMSAQMIRVISSPSSSTTGFFTLILATLASP